MERRLRSVTAAPLTALATTIGIVSLILTGHVARGVLELAWGVAVVVGVSDYVVRPGLVKGSGEAPALVTFAALFGGVAVFGLTGLILGPVLMSTAIAILRIYGRETEMERAGEAAVVA